MRGLAWGQAKREVTALEPLICQRVKEGLTLRQVWQELHGDGKLTVCQSQFYLHVKQIQAPKPDSSRKTGRDLVPQTAPLPLVTVSEQPNMPAPSAPAGDGVHFEHFVVEKQPDLDDGLW